MLQDPSDPSCGLDVQTAYFALAGRLTDLMAKAELHADEAIACVYADDPAKRRRLIDEVLVRLNVDQKVGMVADLAQNIFGEGHSTPTYLRSTWQELKQTRNRLGHGWLTTVDPLRWTVSLQTGVMKHGHVDHEVDLRDLGVQIGAAEELVVHITCVYQSAAHPADPMDYDDLE